MATISAGKYYRFRSKSDGRYLNILINGELSKNLNVTTYALDTDDYAQVWLAHQYSYDSASKFLLKSKKNPAYVLDRFRLSSDYNNADIYTVGTTQADLNDQIVSFEREGDYYRIKLANIDNLYLTVTGTSTYGGYNVKWQNKTIYDSQLWFAEEYVDLRSKISSYNQRTDSKYAYTCAGICGCMAINTHPDNVSYNLLYPEAKWSEIAALANKSSTAVNSTSLSNIYNLLTQGYPVIVRTRTQASAYGEHWVIVYGYIGSTTNITADGFLCIDPYGENSTNSYGKTCLLSNSTHFVEVSRYVYFN